MDVPVDAHLNSETDDDDDEVGEELGLVVEDGDGLVGGANRAEEVELAHF